MAKERGGQPTAAVPELVNVCARVVTPRRYCAERFSGASTSQFAATALLLKLLVDLHGENLENNEKEESPHAKLNLLMREIRNSHRWWTVEEMAEYANLSENNLRKLFREQTGTSPKHFLDQLWLNRAIDLLCSTDLSLADAARKTGCADPYYFFRRFKKLTGYTPAQYRRIYGRKYPSGKYTGSL